jgi:predicted O-methyltransferase YrrM
MDALEYIVKRFNIDLTKESPFHIPCDRSNGIPSLFNELGFKRGVEIGVFEGAYTKALLKKIPGLKLYGIDLWQPYEGYLDSNNTRVVDAYQKALENVKGYDCELIKGWSSEVAKQFENESLDFVFIDGNHAYEYVVQDLAAWTPKVRAGGIIYGHDFDDHTKSHKWKKMGVINAVTGWVKSYKIHPWFVLEGDRNRSWMYVKQ